MAYIALYRRYRSQDFAELVGQEHIRTTLQNALANGQLAQAYLFCGPRGTGKTSTARIVAKAVNCAQGPTATPCNRCEACLGITSGSCIDVIELDAASHTGVDDVREVIVNKVHFPPTEVRRKVYIVDEVHKLSNAAFNALLKTLEEPPPHVMFVLATTDPQNVPATIASRCQRFEFHRIDHATMVRHLRNVCVKEGIEAEEGALHAIADASEGAMRDALVILEQVAAQGGGTVREGTLLATLGLTSHDALGRLVDAVLSHEAGPAIHLLHELQNQGKDLVQLGRDTLEYLRKLLLYRISNDPASLVAAAPALHERLLAQATRVQTAEVYRLVRIMVSLLEDLKDASWVVVLWESTLVRMAHPELDETAAGLAARVSALEQGHVPASPAPPPPPARPATPAPAVRAAESAPPAPPPRAVPPPQPATRPAEPGTGVSAPAPAASGGWRGDLAPAEAWKRILATLQKRESGPLLSFIAEARPLTADPARGEFTISLGQGKTFQKDRIEKSRDAIESAAGEVLGGPVRLKVVLEGQGPSAQGKGHESFVQNAVEMFGGRIVE